MRKSRTFRLALTLALLLNALGSPMSWAHAAGGGTAPPAASDVMAPGCHGHEVPSHDVPDKPGSMPCCDDGGCACAAAPLVMLAAAQAGGIPHPRISVPVDTSALPAHPLDDTLRPPIA